MRTGPPGVDENTSYSKVSKKHIEMDKHNHQVKTDNLRKIYELSVESGCNMITLKREKFYSLANFPSCNLIG